MLNTFAIGTLAALVMTGAAPTTTTVNAQTKDIVETAVAAGSFKTLAKALQAAFAALPAGTIENLLKPENKPKLQRILTYHVVAGRVMAADVVKLQSAKAVSGDTLTVATRSGGVMVNNAHVVKTDIAASNGVIHVIDAVLLPKDE